MERRLRAGWLRALLAGALALAALAGATPAAGASGSDQPFGALGRPITSGPSYDRNASVVQDGRSTYVFFARSRLAPCNRLAGCDPDQRKYDLFYAKSNDGGRSFGGAQLAALNPDPTPDPNPAVPYGAFRGRTVAATKNGSRILVFWADGGNDSQLYKVEKPSGSDSFTPATPVVGADPTFNVEAVTRGSQTFVYTEGLGPGGPGIYAHAYGAGAVSPGVLVMAGRNIPKAIVDARTGAIRMTYVDATAYPQVDVYVNSSSDGLTFGPEHLAVKAAPNEANWDPNLLQVDGRYVLFFAPDRQGGAGRQQIAAATSGDFDHWTRRGDLTPGEKDGVQYWDYWPEGFTTPDGAGLAYTSERGFAFNATGTGHIWAAATGGGDDWGRDR